MGSACCCLRPEEFEELAYNGSIYRHCICLRCFILQFLHAYTYLFQHGENRALASPNQGATPLAAAGLVSASADNNLSSIYRSPPRPLPYDADSRYARLQRDGLVSRHEKASSHFHEESVPLRSSSSGAVESIQEKRNGTGFEGHSKIVHPDSSGRHLLAKVASGVTYMLPSSEDEDVCPTCLEEYTPEDPKIITQCSHHFHLGCIYEWMERSDNCPVCGKVICFKYFRISVFFWERANFLINPRECQSKPKNNICHSDLKMLNVYETTLSMCWRMRISHTIVSPDKLEHWMSLTPFLLEFSITLVPFRKWFSAKAHDDNLSFIT